MKWFKILSGRDGLKWFKIPMHKPRRNTLSQAYFLNIFKKLKPKQTRPPKKLKAIFHRKTKCIGNLWGFGKKNSMHPSVYRLHKKTTQNSLVFFMNKIDLCSTGGVKSQKCEQRTIFFSNSISSIHSIDPIKSVNSTNLINKLKNREDASDFDNF